MSTRGGARPGAGRKSQDPDNKRRRLSTTISLATWQRLTVLTSQTDKSTSQVLDDLVALAAGHPVVAALLASGGGALLVGGSDESMVFLADYAAVTSLPMTDTLTWSRSDPAG